EPARQPVPAASNEGEDGLVMQTCSMVLRQVPSFISGVHFNDTSTSGLGPAFGEGAELDDLSGSLIWRCTS
ncbi:MAG: hypothetical protein ACREDR_00415, partial [Blastocatellia bacterium]